MNQLLRNYIAVEGVEAALKVARTLIEQDYQVMVQLDDCDIYIVSYESNDDHLGDNQFASLSRDEIDIINKYREDENYLKNTKKDIGKRMTMTIVTMKMTIVTTKTMTMMTRTKKIDMDN